MAIIRKHKELGKQFMEAHPDLPELPSNSPKQYEPKLLEDKIINGCIYNHITEIGGGGTADTYEALSPDNQWVVLKQVRVDTKDSPRDIKISKEQLKREGLILEKLLEVWNGNLNNWARECRENRSIEGTVPVPVFTDVNEIVCPYVRVLNKDDQTLVLTYAEGERLAPFELTNNLTPIQRVEALAKYAHAIAIAHKAGFGLSDINPNKGGRYTVDSATNSVGLQLFDLGCTLTNTPEIIDSDLAYTPSELKGYIQQKQREYVGKLASAVYSAFTWNGKSVSEMPLELQDLVYRVAIAKEEVSALECCNVLCNYLGKATGKTWKNKPVVERPNLKQLPNEKLKLAIWY